MENRKTRKAWLHAVVAALLVMFGGAARAQIIDRVLAVVGDNVILLSDYVALTRFGLLEAGSGPDPIAATIPALIERQLQLNEVNRFQPPEPPAEQIDRRMADIRARFGDEKAFETALAETGLTAAQLRARVRNSLRIESYRQQRFAATVQPTEDDIARYYRAHATEFGKAGEIPSFEQVRDEARRRLVAERSELLTRSWIDGLRRRTDVTILYRPENSQPPTAKGQI
jgi:peptidyl-prolyl cis-trans isomerase SurA